MNYAAIGLSLAALLTMAPIAKPDLDKLPADYAQTLNRGAQPASWFPWKQEFDAERAAEADRIDDETAEMAVDLVRGDYESVGNCEWASVRNKEVIRGPATVSEIRTSHNIEDVKPGVGGIHEFLTATVQSWSQSAAETDIWRLTLRDAAGCGALRMYAEEETGNG